MDNETEDGGRPTDESGSPVERRAKPGTHEMSALMDAGKEAGREAGKEVAGSMGLKGYFLQLANLTAVAVGLIVNVMLVMFLMDEIRQSRKSSDQREERYRDMDSKNQNFFASQMQLQRDSEKVRLETATLTAQAASAKMDALIAETRAAQVEMRASRISTERTEKLIQQLVAEKKKADPPEIPFVPEPLTFPLPLPNRPWWNPRFVRP